MRKFYIIIAFASLFGCKKNDNTSVSTNASRDSLSIYMGLAARESENIEKKITYNSKAFEILKRQTNDSLNREKIFQVATNYFGAKDWKKFKLASDLVLDNAVQAKDTFNVAKAYRYKAEYYKNLGINDSSYYFYLKAEKLYTKLKDKENLGRIFLKKGIIQFYANDYLGADISTSQAYNLLRNSSDKEILYQSISMMGIISNEMKDYSKAIEKHKEALNLVRQNNLNDEFNQEATCLSNIGNVYQNINQDKEAISYFQLALQDESLKNRTPELYSTLIDNLAYSKLKLKDDSNLPALFYRSLKIRDSLHNLSGVVLSKLHLSEYYAYKEDTVKSQDLAEEALATARKSKTYSDILASLKQLSVVDHKNASQFSKGLH
ncbi:tetratricopeptide repeat protein [Flavobacterium sp.]|uniref:tetratricopeptide repeat protein n=1 Tax=Flavobacterium sp. TaxID=239 RepID=UPI0039E23FE4